MFAAIAAPLFVAGARAGLPGRRPQPGFLLGVSASTTQLEVDVRLLRLRHQHDAAVRRGVRVPADRADAQLRRRRQRPAAAGLVAGGGVPDLRVRRDRHADPGPVRHDAAGARACPLLYFAAVGFAFLNDTPGPPAHGARTRTSPTTRSRRWTRRPATRSRPVEPVERARRRWRGRRPLSRSSTTHLERRCDRALTPRRDVAVLVNPRAGRGRHRGLLPAVLDALRARPAGRCACSTPTAAEDAAGRLPRRGRRRGAPRWWRSAATAPSTWRCRRSPAPAWRSAWSRPAPATTSRAELGLPGRPAARPRRAIAAALRPGRTRAGRPGPADRPGRRRALVRRGAGGRLRRDRQRAGQPDALAARPAPLRPGHRRRAAPAAAAARTRLELDGARAQRSTAVLVAVGNCRQLRRRHADLPGRRPGRRPARHGGRRRRWAGPRWSGSSRGCYRGTHVGHPLVDAPTGRRAVELEAPRASSGTPTASGSARSRCRSLRPRRRPHAPLTAPCPRWSCGCPYARCRASAPTTAPRSRGVSDEPARASAALRPFVRPGSAAGSTSAATAGPRPRPRRPGCRRPSASAPASAPSAPQACRKIAGSGLQRPTS